MYLGSFLKPYSQESRLESSSSTLFDIVIQSWSCSEDRRTLLLDLQAHLTSTLLAQNHLGTQDQKLAGQ